MIALCPACLAGMALVATGVTSTGGIAAILANKILQRKQLKQQTQTAGKEGEK